MYFIMFLLLVVEANWRNRPRAVRVERDPHEELFV